MESADVCQHGPEDRVNGRRKTTRRESTSLINSTVGTDLGVGGIVVHPVLRGASVPLGEDSCKIRIGLSDAVQHGSARHILEGRFEIKSNKDSGGVSLREVLNGFDHGVCSVWSSTTILQRSPTFGH